MPEATGHRSHPRYGHPTMPGRWQLERAPDHRRVGGFRRDDPARSQEGRNVCTGGPGRGNVGLSICPADDVRTIFRTPPRGFGLGGFSCTGARRTRRLATAPCETSLRARGGGETAGFRQSEGGVWGDPEFRRVLRPGVGFKHGDGGRPREKVANRENPTMPAGEAAATPRR